MKTINEWFEKYSHNPNILNIFSYGSYVYGTNDNLSDKDFICITKDETIFKNMYQEKLYDGDISFYTDDYFKYLINNHEICALECLWNKHYVLNIEHQNKCAEYFNTVYDLHKLRKSFSSKASNSWVKCKKKLTIEKDYNYRIGIKSLFHSIRILYFGCQIGIHHKIVDYTVCNHIWDEIKKDAANENYDFLKKKYKPIYNKWHHNFVLIAPL